MFLGKARSGIPVSLCARQVARSSSLSVTVGQSDENVLTECKLIRFVFKTQPTTASSSNSKRTYSLVLTFVTSRAQKATSLFLNFFCCF